MDEVAHTFLNIQSICITIFLPYQVVRGIVSQPLHVSMLRSCSTRRSTRGRSASSRRLWTRTRCSIVVIKHSKSGIREHLRGQTLSHPRVPRYLGFHCSDECARMAPTIYQISCLRSSGANPSVGTEIAFLCSPGSTREQYKWNLDGKTGGPGKARPWRLLSS